MDFELIWVHLGALGVLVPVILYSDFQGLLWVVGKKQVLSAKTLHVCHWVIWAGLSLMIISGALMAYPLWEYLRTVPAFYVKMFFVLALVVNGVVIGKHVAVASVRPFASLESNAKRALIISGLVSSTGWIGAFIMAGLLGL